MKISILIPVHGVERYIERCARSVLGQEYADVEYIFVDDCSPDRSISILRDVLREYPHRDVRILVHAQNRGLAAARNTAVDAATGDYILHVDSDDYLAPHALERLASRVAATDADIVIFDSIELHNGYSLTRSETYNHASPRDYVGAILNRRARTTLWNKLLRRTLYDSVRAMPGIDYGEDFYTLPQLACHARRIVKLNEPLYYYDCTNDSSFSNTLSPARAAHVVLAAELLEQIFAPRPAYADMIAGMKIHNKISLLQVGDRATWRYARVLYPDLDCRAMTLRPGERLVLWLARHDIYGAMGVYRWLAGLKKRMGK